jgi:hypothetical protein
MTSDIGGAEGHFCGGLGRPAWIKLTRGGL